MSGTLYGVGVGPGDPELMTMQAARIIQKCAVVAVPKTGDGDGAALLIAKSAVPELERKDLLQLYIPMTRDRAALAGYYDRAAGQIADRLRRGEDVAFLTLGDSTIYSTYAYLHRRIERMGLSAQYVAGVPSFCAAAARLNQSLVEGAQPLHILPASYQGADEGLDLPGTKVLMKAGKSFERVKHLLGSRAMLGRARMVQKCGMDGERVYHNLEDAEDGSSYFSIIVVQDEEEAE